jgi:exonuclease III
MEDGNIMEVKNQKTSIKQQEDKSKGSTREPKKKNDIKDNLYLDTLNARTWRTQERETELDNALSEIKISMLGISDTRREGEKIVEKPNGNILYYKGKTKGQRGVGSLIHKSLKHCIQEFIGISDRIAILRAQLNTATVTIIQVYALTEQSLEEEVENFYGYLDEALTKYRAQRYS